MLNFYPAQWEATIRCDDEACELRVSGTGFTLFQALSNARKFAKEKGWTAQPLPPIEDSIGVHEQTAVCGSPAFAAFCPVHADEVLSEWAGYLPKPGTSAEVVAQFKAALEAAWKAMPPLPEKPKDRDKIVPDPDPGPELEP